MSLSVVVPCFDEELRIGSTLATLCEHLGANVGEWEVIVVDDHSSDGTAELVRLAMVDEARIRTVVTVAGKGKGAAVRTGLLAASHEAVAVVDADLAGDLDALAAMLAELVGGADATLGSRLLPGATIEPPRPPARRLAAWFFRSAVRVATPLRVSDPQCGFKVFRRTAVVDHAAALRTEGYAYEVELLMRLNAAGARLVEVPIEWHEGRDSKVRVLRDGAAMLRDLWRARSMAHRS